MMAGGKNEAGRGSQVVLSAESESAELSVKKISLREVGDGAPRTASAVPGAVESVSWVKAPAKTFTPLTEVLAPRDESDDDTAAEQEMALGIVYRRAYAEGLSQAEATVEAMRQRFQQAIAQVAVLRLEILRASEADLVKLAWLIAKEAVLGESDTREEFTLQMVAHALDLLTEADQITLRVCPEDFEALAQAHPDYLERDGRVRLVEDRALSVGGVIAQSNIGRVDGSLETRLREIAGRLAPESGAANQTPSEAGNTVLDVQAVFVGEDEVVEDSANADIEDQAGAEEKVAG